MLKGSIMKEKKMIKGRITKKTRIPRSNILRNIISKKRTKKNITTKSTTGFRELKNYCDDKCKHELAQKRKLLHDKYKEKLSMMKKLRCGNISFAKVALKHAKKFCIKSRAHNVPIRVLDIVYQNQSLLPRTSTFKI